ncbi:GNAT family N-acetyltransferase [Marisediminicola sp. LYQ134]|uniref:GNAT family N-acetyltransferase n=1 Tax=Marisediminicola sp. LYQ134 TaxID=3391061 RepID=UPI00398306B9
MPLADVTIRTTTEDDWPRVRELRVENATDNPVSYGATLETTLAMTEDDWRMRARRGQADDATSIVAIETATGRWIGMMSAQTGDHDGPELILTGVYVTPDFRGRERGVADALLDRIVAWATERGDVLRLWVDENGAPAKRFYERHGFTPTGRSRPIGFAEGRTLEMMRRLR